MMSEQLECGGVPFSELVRCCECHVFFSASGVVLDIAPVLSADWIVQLLPHFEPLRHWNVSMSGKDSPITATRYLKYCTSFMIGT